MSTPRPERQDDPRREGVIVRSNSGFYTVRCGVEQFDCRARGIFRREHLSPLVGDRVRILVRGGEGVVDEILPRRNRLVRPPVANIDLLVLVVSTAEPEPNFYVIDTMTAAALRENIEPAVVVTKSDLRPGEEICAVYRKAGFASFPASGVTGENMEQLRGLLRGRVCAFTGNSGAGKSTLLNALDPSLHLATGSISRKLGRGRHTTRLVELFETCGGLVADTPGFSALEMEKDRPVPCARLQDLFREFGPYIGRCRFTGCSHTCEQGCAVLEAVERGEIPASRHRSYCQMYEEAKSVKEWEIKD